jgi:nicotinamidase-related amidase
MSTALLLIDAQVGFFDGEMPVHDAPVMLDRLTALAERARDAGVPVIFVRHDAEPTIDGPVHPALGPLEGDLVVAKLTPDSFHGTTLKMKLDEQGITTLVVAGFQTELCIDTTVRRARSLGYEVTLVADAHSTFDFADAPLTAEQTIAHHNAILGDFAEVVPLDEVEF